MDECNSFGILYLIFIVSSYVLYPIFSVLQQIYSYFLLEFQWIMYCFKRSVILDRLNEIYFKIFILFVLYIFSCILILNFNNSKSYSIFQKLSVEDTFLISDKWTAALITWYYFLIIFKYSVHYFLQCMQTSYWIEFIMYLAEYHIIMVSFFIKQLSLRLQKWWYNQHLTETIIALKM